MTWSLQICRDHSRITVRRADGNRNPNRGNVLYERFTDRTRKAMQLANQAAQRGNVEWIHPVHVLFGVLHEGSGNACRFLRDIVGGEPGEKNYGGFFDAVKAAAPTAGGQVVMGRLPHTDGTKDVIAASIEAARSLGHNHVGTEHLLLGLLASPDPVVSKLFADAGVTADKVREAVAKAFPPQPPPVPPVPIKTWAAALGAFAAESQEAIAGGWRSDRASSFVTISGGLDAVPADPEIRAAAAAWDALAGLAPDARKRAARWLADRATAEGA